MRWDDERIARAALTAVCEAATPRLAAEVARHGASAVWEALVRGGEESRWSRRGRDLVPAELVEGAERHGIRFLIPGDDEWPEQLAVLDEVEVAGLGGLPFGLWARGPGHLGRWCAQSVAIVGSRASSPYGERVATDLAIDLAGDPAGGWTVVSGGAYGIDGAAHRGARAAGGNTIAVLAGGLDEPYPRGNHAMFEALAAEQLLIAEAPAGLRPTRVAFLARNRLIAALATGTVVVEAAARSGANNTASWAAECGRVLMAVPGPVHSSLSTTPHRLVKQGRAALVCDRADVVALLSPLDAGAEEAVGGQDRLFDHLDPSLMAVREVLPGRGGMSSGEVARAAGLSIPVALASLARLEQMELVRADPSGRWRICTPRRTG